VDKTLLEIAVEARNILATPGKFARNTRHTDDGRCCAIGAIENVTGKHWGEYVYDGERSYLKDELNECAVKLYGDVRVNPNPHFDRNLPVADRVYYVPAPNGVRSLAADSFPFVEVNNILGQEAIVKVFDCAIEKLKTMEPA
jgi:hypothetical protein